MLASLMLAAAGWQFRRTYPQTPNYDMAAVGGMLGAVSFLIGFHIIFFERRRPGRYRTALQRFALAAVLWLGGCAGMIWNLSTTKPTAAIQTLLAQLSQIQEIFEPPAAVAGAAGAFSGRNGV
jgi:hypothetical protein